MFKINFANSFLDKDIVCAPFSFDNLLYHLIEVYTDYFTLSLSLVFLNTAGTKSSITISDVKEDLTAEEVKALMNLIIEKDFFLNAKGSFVKPSAAQLIQREVKKFEIK